MTAHRQLSACRAACLARFGSGIYGCADPHVQQPPPNTPRICLAIARGSLMATKPTRTALDGGSSISQDAPKCRRPGLGGIGSHLLPVDWARASDLILRQAASQLGKLASAPRLAIGRRIQRKLERGQPASSRPGHQCHRVLQALSRPIFSKCCFDRHPSDEKFARHESVRRQIPEQWWARSRSQGEAMMTNSAYVGRVGGLAVALGIGAAVASGNAVASASPSTATAGSAGAATPSATVGSAGAPDPFRPRKGRPGRRRHSPDTTHITGPALGRRPGCCVHPKAAPTLVRLDRFVRPHPASTVVTNTIERSRQIRPARHRHDVDVCFHARSSPQSTGDRPSSAGNVDRAGDTVHQHPDRRVGRLRAGPAGQQPSTGTGGAPDHVGVGVLDTPPKRRDRLRPIPHHGCRPNPKQPRCRPRPPPQRGQCAAGRRPRGQCGCRAEATSGTHHSSGTRAGSCRTGRSLPLAGSDIPIHLLQQGPDRQPEPTLPGHRQPQRHRAQRRHADLHRHPGPHPGQCGSEPRRQLHLHPGRESSSTGGTDSFTITVDDGSAYRLPGVRGVIRGWLHSFAQAIGLSGPDTTTATITVSAVQPPSGFTATTLVSGLDPTDGFRFLPDGRILIAQKGGAIQVANANGQLQSTPLITLPSDSTGRAGCSVSRWIRTTGPRATTTSMRDVHRG